jgi:hypothetical protein
MRMLPGIEQYAIIRQIASAISSDHREGDPYDQETR